jgi:hypothetical protein
MMRRSDAGGRTGIDLTPGTFPVTETVIRPAIPGRLILPPLLLAVASIVSWVVVPGGRSIAGGLAGAALIGWAIIWLLHRPWRLHSYGATTGSVRGGPRPLSRLVRTNPVQHLDLEQVRLIEVVGEWASFSLASGRLVTAPVRLFLLDVRVRSAIAAHAQRDGVVLLGQAEAVFPSRLSPPPPLTND